MLLVHVIINTVAASKFSNEIWMTDHIILGNKWEFYNGELNLSKLWIIIMCILMLYAKLEKCLFPVELYWLQGHKSETVSILISISLSVKEYIEEKWDWDQKWDRLPFMAPEPGDRKLISQLRVWCQTYTDIHWLFALLELVI